MCVRLLHCSVVAPVHTHWALRNTFMCHAIDWAYVQFACNWVTDRLLAMMARCLLQFQSTRLVQNGLRLATRRSPLKRERALPGLAPA